MSEYKIYHNPRCSKSRQTLELMREKGVEPEIVEYLKSAPTKDEVLGLIDMIGGPVNNVIRQKEEAFKAMNVDIGDAEMVANAIAQEPKLLERPIVVCGRRAIIGRPPENVLSLLS